MAKFLVDAPIRDVIRAFERLGFVLVREGNHISMARENSDGTKTTLTMPNHRTLKASTLRTILSQVSVARDDFLREYRQ